MIIPLNINDWYMIDILLKILYKLSIYDLKYYIDYWYIIKI
jgi:hypothetical protein